MQLKYDSTIAFQRSSSNKNRIKADKVKQFPMSDSHVAQYALHSLAEAADVCFSTSEQLM